jgi:cell wall-associated NlpC family hydrolase
MLIAATALSGAVAAPAALAQAAPEQGQPQPGSQAPAQGPSTGGREYGQDDPVATPTVPGSVAQVVDGVAYAPADAPDPVKELIWQANRIIGMPYVYGGGHRSFVDSGYDCSGTVSYALHGGGMLNRPRDSRDFFRFGQAGPGQWVTIFTNSGHAYLTVAGIRLDTSAADDPAGGKGPRWRPLRPSDRGFRARHPRGF